MNLLSVVLKAIKLYILLRNPKVSDLPRMYLDVYLYLLINVLLLKLLLKL